MAQKEKGGSEEMNETTSLISMLTAFGLIFELIIIFLLYRIILQLCDKNEEQRQEIGRKKGTIVLCKKADCMWARLKKEGSPVCEAGAICIFDNHECNAYNSKSSKGRNTNLKKEEAKK